MGIFKKKKRLTLEQVNADLNAKIVVLSKEMEALLDPFSGVYGYVDGVKKDLGRTTQRVYELEHRITILAERIELLETQVRTLKAQATIDANSVADTLTSLVTNLRDAVTSVKGVYTQDQIKKMPADEFKKEFIDKVSV